MGAVSWGRRGRYAICTYVHSNYIVAEPHWVTAYIHSEHVW